MSTLMTAKTDLLIAVVFGLVGVFLLNDAPLNLMGAVLLAFGAVHFQEYRRKRRR
ncbi:hypothetical protein LCGC14_0878760 [marine sediment metagenome]|uniref:Uncharacterized protein n=1 Tax=marine sediment metagenome TaxID=412755 RepID=A0A0F9RM01_9ZZZZ